MTLGPLSTLPRTPERGPGPQPASLDLRQEDQADLQRLLPPSTEWTGTQMETGPLLGVGGNVF